MTQKISYLNYLKLVTEFENLKDLIFNKEQKILFNFYSIPKLSLDLKKEVEHYDTLFPHENLAILLKYIKKLVNKPELMTDIDNKLLSSMDDELWDIITMALI